MSRLAGVVFFFGEPAAYRHARTRRSGVLRAGGGAAVHRHRGEAAAPKAPAAAAMTGVSALVSSGRLAGSWRAIFAGVVVLGFAGGLVDLRPVLPRGAAPYFGPTRITSSSARSAPKATRACRTGSGWCCRGSSRTCCPAPAATPRSACCRRGDARDADRPLEGHRRVPARRHQLRLVPHRQLPAARRRPADDLVPAGRRIRRRRRHYFRFLFACRGGPALQRRRRSSARSPRTTGCRSLDRLLIPVRDHPGARGVRCGAHATSRTRGCASGPTGGPAASIRSTR